MGFSISLKSKIPTTKLFHPINATTYLLDKNPNSSLRHEVWLNSILVKIANYPLLYWWMNSSNFRSIQLLKEWPWHRKFGKSLILALLSLSSVSHIPYYINFRFNNGPNMSSILACFFCQFVILEACSCLKNDHDSLKLVSHWYQLDFLLVRSVIFRITSTSGLIIG